ncbi:hypothetical protein GCM10009689_00190 [Brevibacterium antiquum]
MNRTMILTMIPRKGSDDPDERKGPVRSARDRRPEIGTLRVGRPEIGTPGETNDSL